MNPMGSLADVHAAYKVKRFVTFIFVSTTLGRDLERSHEGGQHNFHPIPSLRKNVKLKHFCRTFKALDMAVSKNRGGPQKWMVYNGKPYY